MTLIIDAGRAQPQSRNANLDKNKLPIRPSVLFVQFGGHQCQICAPLRPRPVLLVCCSLFVFGSRVQELGAHWPECRFICILVSGPCYNRRGRRRLRRARTTSARHEDAAAARLLRGTLGQLCVHPDSITLFGTGTQLMVAGHQQPTLLIFQPSAEEMTTRGTATLLCVVSDLPTPFAPVSWTAEGCSPSLVGRSSAPVRQPDGTFAMSSSLTVPAAHWREGCVFACTVQQGERRVQVRLRRSECWVSVQKEK
ncbi:IGL1 protein, partial [Polypterus senegalus]